MLPGQSSSVAHSETGSGELVTTGKLILIGPGPGPDPSPVDSLVGYSDGTRLGLKDGKSEGN